MSSAPQFGLPPAALAGIKEALGCMVIGTVLSTGVYGISILQAYIYFRSKHQDSTPIKSLAALVFALDTISVILTVSGLYDYVVTDFGDPFALLSVPPILALENGITVLVGTLTQCFFAHRLWTLSKRNTLLVTSVVILSLCSFGGGLAISVNLYTHKDIYFLGSFETRMLAGFANSLSVVCDVVIAVALCYYFNSIRTGFRRTDFVIDRLMLYAVNRGALTALCQALHMITTVALPGRFIFIPFVRLEGKLYCNTLLATLNARESMRASDGKNTVELGSHILSRMDASTSGHGQCQSTVERESGDASSTGKPTFKFSEEKTQDAERTLIVGGDV